jgi:hypothetical protein
VPSYGHNILVVGIDGIDSTSQASYQCIYGLVRHTVTFVLRPNRGDDLVAAIHAARLLPE